MLLPGENLTLKEYLFLNEMEVQEFSRKIGYSRVHVSNLLNGNTFPCKRVLEAIERHTGGLVKKQTIINEYKKTFEKKMKELEE